MPDPRQISDHAEPASTSGRPPFDVTDGEINFLWSFIQGSIVIPETWNALLRGYGFCERHAWIHLGIEMSFRDYYLLGPTILYAELIDRSLHAVETPRTHSAMRRLRAAGPCLLCAAKVKDASAGACPPARLARARDTAPLRNFAGQLRSLWWDLLCPVCSRQDDRISSYHCRRHFIGAVKAGQPVDLAAQRSMLRDLAGGVARYQGSFLAGGRRADDHDRAALIAAVGWCGGWRPLLAQFSTNG